MGKFTFLYTILLVLVCINQSLAQMDEEISPHNLTAKVLFNDYALPNGLDSDSLKMSNGLEFGYIRNINRYMNIGFPIKIGLANVSGHMNKRTIFSADAILQLQYAASDDAIIVPYVFGGGGIVTENFEGSSVQFPVGLGANFRVGKHSFLNVQAEFRKSQAEERDNLQYGVGFLFNLTKGSDTIDPTLDTDGDSVPDIQDECPTEVGLPGLLGCPDTDGDGIADKIDECPDVVGLAATLGCPDQDEDGVKDMNDLCPEVAGPASNKGCPVEDEEPEPMAPSDRDGDGVIDSADACPDTYGPTQTAGCPDSDNDGLADNVDDCPNQPGPLSRKGCPTLDSDGDGIVDDLDACPTVAGPILLEGCPDSDGDGIIDKNDDCPEVAGHPATNGCPNIDSDGDGVLDANDQCPYAAGPANTGGCPDSDGDGIVDSVDACPQEAGPRDRQGCPFYDADNDGVEDRYDQCPTEPGLPSLAGCPDADGDGVTDKEDNCPTIPGIYNGCPDTDGDGIDDSADSCPNTPGPATNYGCPEIKPEEKVIIEQATQLVVFEIGKATLKAESYAVLDEVAAILLKYPDYKVMISGHTDNTGRAENNMILSEERASSCLEYLVSQGISRFRMGYRGLGQTDPIATNDTEEGRELNRRVEFELYVR